MANNGLTVLVVGGAGYIGSHVVKTLLENHHKVIILDNLSTGSERLIVGDEFIAGDLRDENVLTSIFSEQQFDAVMHFAAFSIVGESKTNPIKYYENNVVGTSILLRTMIHHGVNRFIFSSSAAVYGDPETIPMDENHRCMPINPYGATKLAVERMLKDYSTAYDMTYTCLRYFNAAGADPSGTIGEIHNPETHLIPLLLKTAIEKSAEMKIFGNDYDTPDGTCIRDYIHVNDLADAHLLALEMAMDEKVSNIYNLGNSEGHSVLDVVETVRKVTGHTLPVRIVSRREGDPARLVADSLKARSQLGWRPKFEDLTKIVDTAWNWHKGAGRTVE